MPVVNAIVESNGAASATECAAIVPNGSQAARASASAARKSNAGIWVAGGHKEWFAIGGIVDVRFHARITLSIFCIPVLVVCKADSIASSRFPVPHIDEIRCWSSSYRRRGT